MNENRYSWAAMAFVWTLVLAMPVGLVRAQQTAAPGKTNAQIEAGEPRADTSSAASVDSSETAVGADAPAPAAQSSARAGSATQSSATKAVARATSTTGGNAVATGTGTKGAKSADRLDLGTATVTGDREQPKVMYIVPWKQSDIGDLSGKPMNSLLDEALAPVDRDEFKREVAYYNAAQTPQNGASAPAAKQGEK